MSVIKLETTTGGTISIPRENFDTLDYDEKEWTYWECENGYLHSLRCRLGNPILDDGWYYSKENGNVDPLETALISIETFDAAKAQVVSSGQTKQGRIAECEENIADLEEFISNEKSDLLTIWKAEYVEEFLSSEKSELRQWQSELAKAQSMPEVEISEAIINFHYAPVGAYRSWTWGDFLVSFNEYWKEDMVYMPINKPDETDTISAEDFLRREMADSEVSEDNYDIDTANLGLHSTVDLDLTMEVNGVFAICLVLGSNGDCPMTIYVDYLYSTTEVTEFANLVQLASSIVQKWQAHCEATL